MARTTTVTPLDVVRVRLQSQSPVMRVATGATAPSAMFKELPPNLGVTACCREVFWVGNNTQFCIAGGGGSHTVPNGGMGNGNGNTLASDCLVEETQRKNFTSTLDGLRKIARNEGPLSLWRGLSPTLIMAIPANVIYFTGYDWLRYDRNSPIARFVHDSWAPLVAGSAARISAASVISPVEMFRTRLQATSGSGADHFKATLHRLHQMTQTQGYSSLWRGLTLMMWRDVPFSALYWWGYETVKNGLVDLQATTTTTTTPATTTTAADPGSVYPRNDNAITFLNSFTAGGLSGAASAFITTPFDVAKTRKQVFRHTGEESTISSLSSSSSSSSSPSSSSSRAPPRPEQRSIPQFLLHIVREEGLYGLFRGWAARCLKVAPACAIMISSYEVGKNMAGLANDRREVTRLEGEPEE